MVNAWVTEHGGFDRDDGKVVEILKEPALVEQTVLAFTTAAQTAVFNVNTRYVRFMVDAAARVSFGTNPTADANSARLEAGVEYVRRVNGADSIRASFYDGVT